VVDRVGPGGIYWEEDPHFDIRLHVRHIALPEPGDMTTLQDMVSILCSEEMEANRPLWRFYLIDNVDGGCALFGRIHHAIADGVALVQVLMSLTDESALFQRAATPATRTNRPSRGLFTLPGRLVRKTSGAVASVLSMGTHELLQTSTRSERLIQAAYTAGLLSVTTAAILTKLLIIPNDDKSIFSGELGSAKRVVWSDAVHLLTAKAIGRAYGATVNDVLVAALAGALRKYSLDHDKDGEAVDIRAMVPVNLRDVNSPIEKLGNQFALVYLTLPLELETPHERLAEVKRQMDVLKQSPEPLIVYELLNIIGMFPGELADRVTQFFSSKASSVLTNVPGPRQPIFLAGVELKRIMFWVPQTGQIGLGISIISYAGEVSIGVMVDEALIPYPEEIVQNFRTEFGALAADIGQTQLAGNGADGIAVPTDAQARVVDPAP
jgi:WS/DGAT/MGAT family acyltransferase